MGCFRCNTTKAGDIASFDDITDQITLLYHPRTQSWDDHFETVGPLITGKTPVGRVTIRILKMNSEKQINARQLLIDMGAW